MKKKCKCGFCESELKMGCFEPAFCKPCDVKLKECKNCGQLYKADLKKCPKCGQ